MQLAPGVMLAGRYRIKEELGRGGMGVVLRAEDTELRRDVALKLLLPEAAFEQGFVDRFLTEAKAGASLQSPHAVSVYHTGKLEGGAPYIVMELLRGDDLSHILSRHGKLRIDEAVWYILQAAEALAEAHRQHVVHRDLKPANLFLAQGRGDELMVKILDFGIAKLTVADEIRRSLRLTKEDQVLGTPLYMSPEQRHGEPVDERTDIWSLGTVLYELVTGDTPFPSGNILELEMAIHEEPPRPLSQFLDEVPDGFEKALFGCLEKKPEDRYANVAEMAAALAPFGPSEAFDLAVRAAKVRGVEVDGVRPDSVGRMELARTKTQWSLTRAVLADSQVARATPMSAVSTLTGLPLPRNRVSLGIFALLTASLVGGGAWMATRPAETFDARVSLAPADGSPCLLDDGNLKVIAFLPKRPVEVKLDRHCKGTLRGVGTSVLGESIHFKLLGTDQFKLAHEGEVTLGRQTRLAIQSIRVDEPEPQPEEPKTAAGVAAEAAPSLVIAVRVRADAGGCPRSLQRASLAVAGLSQLVGKGCKPQLSLPGRLRGQPLSFVLSGRCHTLATDMPVATKDDDRLVLDVVTKTACISGGCKNECQCWDSNGFPCSCARPCKRPCAGECAP